MLHFLHKCTRRGKIVGIRVAFGAYPAFLCLGAVVRVVLCAALALFDEGGGEFALCGECAEDFTARAEEIARARKGGDGVLGADIRAVRLKEGDARIFDAGDTPS